MQKYKNIRLILAISLNGVIGLSHPGERKNYLPWKLKGDMATFRKKTKGGAVVMGRITQETIPAQFFPLQDRRNFVLTSSKGREFPGAEKFSSVDEVLAFAEANPDIIVWIIGGTQTYQQFIPYAEEIHLTRVEAEIHENGTLPGPNLFMSEFGTPHGFFFSSETAFPADEDNDYNFTIKVFKKTLTLEDIELLRKRALQQIKKTLPCRKSLRRPVERYSCRW
jgi:dihydrofolate reductase